MKCPKCGSENNDAKFCKNCGEKLNVEKAPNNSKKIIIGLIVVIIVLAGIALYASGILTPEVELKTESFDGFELDVPVGTNYVLSESYTQDQDNFFFSYWNKNENTFDLVYFIVGTKMSGIAEINNELVENDNGLKVYKNESDGEAIYSVVKEADKTCIILSGSNPETLKRIANTYKEGDFSKVVTPTTTSTSQKSASSSQNDEKWVTVDTYSGSGSGSESITIPAGKIMVKLSAYPIKNYATNHLYVTGSNGESGGVDWGSTSAVETKSDSFTYNSNSPETFTIEYYETVNWEVEILKAQ